MNGSSANGNCLIIHSGDISLCADPTSSVLFDGVIPTLTGLDGDVWASQLLTLRQCANIIFNFNGVPGLFGRLEVVMFNCPNMGISASTIEVSASSSQSGGSTPLRGINISITSCDSLVRVCTPISTDQPTIILNFTTDSCNPIMVYLAEVTFYAASSASTCPPDTIITTAPPTEETTTTEETTATEETTQSSIINQVGS